MSALVRYETPASSLAEMIDEFLGGNFFSLADRNLKTSAWWPRVDITEEDDAYRIHADMPGIDKNEIKISVEDNKLTIAGEKKEEKRDAKKDRFYHYERSYGAFSRSFNLPDHVDHEHIEARYRNGVLEVTLRKNERAKPKAIDIKVE
jgi:HSP20 family protein